MFGLSKSTFGLLNSFALYLNFSLGVFDLKPKLN